MVDEPDNLVLRMLCEIRAKLDKFDEHDKRFDRIDKKLDVMQFQLTQSLGLAMAANLASTHTGERVDTVEERQKRLDDGLAEIRRKVAEMEARREG